MGVFSHGRVFLGNVCCGWAGLGSFHLPRPAALAIAGKVATVLRPIRSAVKGLRNHVANFVMNAQQCRMARAGLGLGVRELAAAADVSTNTIARLERGEALYPRTLAAIRTALEAAGVEFTNGDAPGVRLKSSK